MTDKTNLSVSYRNEDSAVILSTDAWVSHHKNAGPCRSTFSLTVEDAEKLACKIFDLIDSLERKVTTEEVFDPTDPYSRMYENEILK